MKTLKELRKRGLVPKKKQMSTMYMLSVIFWSLIVILVAGNIFL